MAKSNKSAAQTASTSTANAAQTIPTAVAEPNKSQAIRDYALANPSAKPSEIAKALTEQGIKVGSGRVSTILNGKKKAKAVQLDLSAQIKLASAFVKGQCDGKIDDAKEAVEAVATFVESCGGAAGARAALATYEAAVAALA